MTTNASIAELSVNRLYFGTSGMYMTIDNNKFVIRNANGEEKSYFLDNTPVSWATTPTTKLYPYTQANSARLTLEFTHPILSGGRLATDVICKVSGIEEPGHKPIHYINENEFLDLDWTPPDNPNCTLEFINLFDGTGINRLETLNVDLYDAPVFQNFDTITTFSTQYNYTGLYKLTAVFNVAIQSITSITASDATTISNIVILPNPDDNKIQFDWQTGATSSVTLTFNGLLSVDNALDIPPEENILLTLNDPPANPQWIGQNPITSSTTYNALVVRFNKDIQVVQGITTTNVGTVISNITYSNGDVIFDVTTGSDITGLSFTFVQVEAVDGGRIATINLSSTVTTTPVNWVGTVANTKEYPYTTLQMQFSKVLISNTPVVQVLGSGTIANVTINSGYVQFDWTPPDATSAVLTFNNIWDGNAFVNGETFNVNLYDDPIFGNFVGITQFSKSFSYTGVNKLVTEFSENIQTITGITTSDGSVISNVAIQSSPNENRIEFEWVTQNTASVTLTYQGLVTASGAIDVPPLESINVVLADQPTNFTWFQNQPVYPNTIYNNIQVSFSSSVQSVGNVTTNLAGNPTNITVVSGRIQFDYMTPSDITGIQYTFTDIIATDGGRLPSITETTGPYIVDFIVENDISLTNKTKQNSATSVKMVFNKSLSSPPSYTGPGITFGSGVLSTTTVTDDSVTFTITASILGVQNITSSVISATDSTTSSNLTQEINTVESLTLDIIATQLLPTINVLQYTTNTLYSLFIVFTKNLNTDQTGMTITTTNSVTSPTYIVVDTNNTRMDVTWTPDINTTTEITLNNVIDSDGFIYTITSQVLHTVLPYTIPNELTTAYGWFDPSNYDFITTTTLKVSVLSNLIVDTPIPSFEQSNDTIRPVFSTSTNFITLTGSNGIETPVFTDSVNYSNLSMGVIMKMSSQSLANRLIAFGNSIGILFSDTIGYSSGNSEVIGEPSFAANHTDKPVFIYIYATRSGTTHVNTKVYINKVLYTSVGTAKLDTSSNTAQISTFGNGVSEMGEFMWYDHELIQNEIDNEYDRLKFKWGLPINLPTELTGGFAWYDVSITESVTESGNKISRVNNLIPGSSIPALQQLNTASQPTLVNNMIFTDGSNEISTSSFADNAQYASLSIGVVVNISTQVSSDRLNIFGNSFGLLLNNVIGYGSGTGENIGTPSTEFLDKNIFIYVYADRNGTDHTNTEVYVNNIQYTNVAASKTDTSSNIPLISTSGSGSGNIGELTWYNHKLTANEISNEYDRLKFKWNIPIALPSALDGGYAWFDVQETGSVTLATSKVVSIINLVYNSPIPSLEQTNDSLRPVLSGNLVSSVGVNGLEASFVDDVNYANISIGMVLNITSQASVDSIKIFSNIIGVVLSNTIGVSSGNSEVIGNNDFTASIAGNNVFVYVYLERSGTTHASTEVYINRDKYTSPATVKLDTSSSPALISTIGTGTSSFGEIMWYNHKLSESELEDEYGRLQSKWNLPVDYPVPLVNTTVQFDPHPNNLTLDGSNRATNMINLIDQSTPIITGNPGSSQPIWNGTVLTFTALGESLAFDINYTGNWSVIQTIYYTGNQVCFHFFNSSPNDIRLNGDNGGNWLVEVSGVDYSLGTYIEPTLNTWHTFVIVNNNGEVTLYDNGKIIGYNNSVPVSVNSIHEMRLFYYSSYQTLCNMGTFMFVERPITVYEMQTVSNESQDFWNDGHDLILLPPSITDLSTLTGWAGSASNRAYIINATTDLEFVVIGTFNAIIGEHEISVLQWDAVQYKYLVRESQTSILAGSSHGGVISQDGSKLVKTKNNTDQLDVTTWNGSSYVSGQVITTPTILNSIHSEYEGISLSSDGNTLIAQSSSGGVFMYKNSGGTFFFIGSLNKPFGSISMSPDGNIIGISTINSSLISVYKFNGSAYIITNIEDFDAGSSAGQKGISISNNGHFVVTGTSEIRTFRWNGSTYDSPHIQSGISSTFSYLRTSKINEDGDQLVTPGSLIYIWNSTGNTWDIHSTPQVIASGYPQVSSDGINYLVYNRVSSELYRYNYPL